MSKLALKIKKKESNENAPGPVDLSGAVLIAVETHQWGNMKKLTPEKLGKISRIKLSNWINGTKQLMDKKIFADLQSTITKFRNTVKAASLPFPLQSVYIVPKPKIPELIEELDLLKDLVQEMILSIEPDWEAHIEKAEEELGPEFFNKADYPKDIRERFSVDYRLVDISVSLELKEFAPDVYEKEHQKFLQTMEEARKEGIIFLRQGFFKVISHLTDMLTGEMEDGEKRIVRQDTLNRMDEFFTEFKNKNIFKDHELENLINQARDTIFGYDAQDIRDSETLRSIS